MKKCVLGRPLCSTCVWFSNLVGPDRFVHVRQDEGVTYCDDIQDAEKTVDTVSWVNLLHHTFFAVLAERDNTWVSVCPTTCFSHIVDIAETEIVYRFLLQYYSEKDSNLCHQP